MNDLEARFTSLRDRARAGGNDLYLIVGPRLYEGERAALKYPRGLRLGQKAGRDDAGLAESLAVVDGIVTMMELTAK